MPNPTPTPALTGLPEEIREAIHAYGWDARALGEWDLDDDLPVRVLEKRAADSHTRLVAAITAALARGAADARDAARYRFLRDNPLGFRAVDGNAGIGFSVPLGQHLDGWIDDLIEDTSLSTTRAGEVSHG